MSSREERRKQQLLEEQRKAGTIPAEVDADTGPDINPHIPQYISKAPWYIDSGEATLRHQRVADKSQVKDEKWYVRGARAGPAATKYRKGACENCGAMTHKTKECMERPRKVGARWSGKDIAADEVVTDVELGFEAKRDRWNGYDSTHHMEKIQEYEMIEEARKKAREKEIQEKIAKGELDKLDLSDSDVDEDEDKYADKSDMPGQQVDEKARVTVRNLRIREDTAKYLLNLDPNSAYYDPKTRSMRQNPLAGTEKETSFQGDNFVRYSGDATKMAHLQLFAWQAEERGKNVNLQANPTMGELIHKEYMRKKDEVSSHLKQSILEKYGGEEHLKAPPKELLLAQTEQYVEYNPQGRVIKGQERAKAKSRYEEDVYPGNHKSVWGSYWKDGKWGYKCCHSFVRNSYCTGESGIEAERARQEMLVKAQEKEAERGVTLADQHMLNLAKDAIKEKEGKGKKRAGEIEVDREKLKAAVERERKRRKMDEFMKKSDGDERAVPKGESCEVTEEEMEQYRRSRQIFDDPMKNYVDEEDKE